MARGGGRMYTVQYKGETNKVQGKTLNLYAGTRACDVSFDTDAKLMLYPNELALFGYF